MNPVEAAGVVVLTGVTMAVVGTVAVLTGQVVATHADATRSVLAVGSPISDGDVIETGNGASVSIRFLDDTTLALDEGARVIVDSLVYDPTTASGSARIQLLEGLFVIVAGTIAGSGPDALQLSTPVATIGIRGTSLAILAGAEGTRNLVVLLSDPVDGDLGEAVISNGRGKQVLDEANEATAITSSQIEPSVPFLLSRHQLEDLFGGAILASPFAGRLYEGQYPFETTPPDRAIEDEQRANEAAAPQAVAEPEQGPDLYVTIAGDLTDGTASTVLGVLDVSGASASSFGDFLGLPGSDAPSVADTGETATDDDSTTDSASDGDRDEFVPGSDAGVVGGGGGGGGAVVDMTVIGGTGGDLLVGTADRDSLIGGLGADTLEGRGGDDVLDGGDGRDLVLGEAGDDTLLGGAEDDSLAGGTGNDLIVGGSGLDTAFFADASGPVQVSLGIAGPQSVGGGLGSDDLQGIEQLSGSAFNDVLTGDGAANNLQGRVGDDRLVGGGGNDELFGDEGHDQLLGGAGSDFLVGGLDGDDVTGGLGADALAYDFPADGAQVAANVTAAGAGLTAGVEYDRLLDFSTAQGDLVSLGAAAFGLPQGPLLVSGVNFSQISVPYDGTNAQQLGSNSEFAAGRPSAVFSTADSTLYFDPDGAAPGYTVLAEVNVTLDATDIRTF